MRFESGKSSGEQKQAMRFESKVGAKFKINGKEVSEDEFWNSKENGTHQYYFSNGQIEFEQNYLNSKPHGLQRYWYSNGQMEYEHNYLLGQLHGLHRGWKINGQVAYEVIFVNGINRNDLKDNKLAQIVIFGRVIE